MKGREGTVRSAQESEIAHLAQLWYDGWQDAHAGILPAELARYRTLESFGRRLRASLSQVRVTGPIGAPVGLCMVMNDELNQLYVSADARGTGVAALMLTDAEKRIRHSGFTAAWLACAIGNQRAARFYEKNNWVRTGNVVIEHETPGGVIALEVWRYEKALT